MYGSDPLGLLSWRFLLDEGGYGVTSDLLSHAVDLAHMLLGPITRVVGTTRDVHPRAAARPARPGVALRPRRAPGDPTGAVTNEDYAGMLCEFAARRARHVRGQPHDRRPREPDGLRRLRHARARPAGTSSSSTSCSSTAPTDDRGSGYTTVLGGDRFPYHGALRARRAQRDRLRGPRRHRGLRVLPRGRRGAPVRARASTRRCDWVRGPGRAAALGAQRDAGRTSSSLDGRT